MLTTEYLSKDHHAICNNNEKSYSFVPAIHKNDNLLLQDSVNFVTHLVHDVRFTRS